MIAAITAGGRVDDDLATEFGTHVKALAAVGGIPMLERAIAAARTAGAKRIAVIGGSEVQARYGDAVDEVVPESPDGRENVRRAMGRGADEPLVLLSSDMPFLRGRDVERFLAAAREVDVALPLAEGDDYERRFPGAPAHVTRVGRDRVANGSIVYFGPGVAPRALDVAARLFAARKSLFRMAALLGAPLLLRHLTGSLRIEHVEARGRTLLDLHVRGIRGSAPELCFDVDTVADFRYARDVAAPR
jgi:GTP:adenosylcobinamide-phosphate guanylyltransferase